MATSLAPVSAVNGDPVSSVRSPPSETANPLIEPPEFATYTCCPFGLTATPRGPAPVVAECSAASWPFAPMENVSSLPAPPSATNRCRPSGLTAIPSGAAIGRLAPAPACGVREPSVAIAKTVTPPDSSAENSRAPSGERARSEGLPPLVPEPWYCSEPLLPTPYTDTDPPPVRATYAWPPSGETTTASGPESNVNDPSKDSDPSPAIGPVYIRLPPPDGVYSRRAASGAEARTAPHATRAAIDAGALTGRAEPGHVLPSTDPAAGPPGRTRRV